MKQFRMRWGRGVNHVAPSRHIKLRLTNPGANRLGSATMKLIPAFLIPIPEQNGQNMLASMCLIMHNHVLQNNRGCCLYFWDSRKLGIFAW